MSSWYQISPSLSNVFEGLYHYLDILSIRRWLAVE